MTGGMTTTTSSPTRSRRHSIIERRFIPLPWEVRSSSTTSRRCGRPTSALTGGGSLRAGGRLALSDRVVAPGLEGGAGVRFVLRADEVQEDFRCVDATWMQRAGEGRSSPSIASTRRSSRSATISNPVCTTDLEATLEAGAGRAGKSTDMSGLPASSAVTAPGSSSGGDFRMVEPLRSATGLKSGTVTGREGTDGVPPVRDVFLRGEPAPRDGVACWSAGRFWPSGASAYDRRPGGRLGCWGTVTATIFRGRPMPATTVAGKSAVGGRPVRATVTTRGPWPTRGDRVLEGTSAERGESDAGAARRRPGPDPAGIGRATHFPPAAGRARARDAARAGASPLATETTRAALARGPPATATARRAAEGAGGVERELVAGGQGPGPKVAAGRGGGAAPAVAPPSRAPPVESAPSVVRTVEDAPSRMPSVAGAMRRAVAGAAASRPAAGVERWSRRARPVAAAATRSSPRASPPVSTPRRASFVAAAARRSIPGTSAPGQSSTGGDGSGAGRRTRRDEPVAAAATRTSPLASPPASTPRRASSFATAARRSIPGTAAPGRSSAGGGGTEGQAEARRRGCRGIPAGASPRRRCPERPSSPRRRPARARPPRRHAERCRDGQALPQSLWDLRREEGVSAALRSATIVRPGPPDRRLARRCLRASSAASEGRGDPAGRKEAGVAGGNGDGWATTRGEKWGRLADCQ